jgi:hypothetical protein
MALVTLTHEYKEWETCEVLWFSFVRTDSETAFSSANCVLGFVLPVTVYYL